MDLKINFFTKLLLLISLSSHSNSLPTSPEDTFSSKLMRRASENGGTLSNSDALSMSLLREFVANFLKGMKDSLVNGKIYAERSSRSDDSLNFPKERAENSFQKSPYDSSLNFQRASSQPSPQFSHVPKTSLVRKGIVERVERPGWGSTQVRQQKSESKNSEEKIRMGKAMKITSQPLQIIDGPRGDKRGRSLKEIEVQGVKVIVGERVPDTEEDKLFTWRNGRVIKGVLYPNESPPKVPAEVTVNSAHQSKVLKFEN